MNKQKKADIQRAIGAALLVVVRLRAMKKSRDDRDLQQFRLALANDLNDLNFRTQTL